MWGKSFSGNPRNLLGPIIAPTIIRANRHANFSRKIGHAQELIRGSFLRAKRGDLAPQDDFFLVIRKLGCAPVGGWATHEICNSRHWRAIKTNSK